MAEFSRLIITNKGKELLNSGLLTEGSLEFVCAELSGRAYGEEELGALERLEEVWHRNPVRKTAVEKDAVTVDFMVSNEDMESGHFIRTVGLYAVLGGGEEVLFAAAVEKTGGCYMPEHSETVTSLQMKLRFKIDNAEKVKLIVDAGGMAAMGDVLEIRDMVLEEARRAEKKEEQLNERIQAEKQRASKKETELEEKKLDRDGDASDTVVNFRPAEQLEPLQSGAELGEQFGRLAKAAADLAAHLADRANPHEVTKEQVGLGNADNTADADKPVSAAQQAALDALYTQMAAYADKKTADLINGAPSTLDTLGEIANAMQENADVVSALDSAIGKKADAAEFDSHMKDRTAHVTDAERSRWDAAKTFYFVAASDALKDEKDAADYVCSGRGDQDTINLAVSDMHCDAAGRNEAGSGMGEVRLSSGTFHITGPVELYPTITLRGCGKGTEMLLETAETIFSLCRSSCLRDFRIVRNVYELAAENADYIITCHDEPGCTVENIYFSGYDFKNGMIEDRGRALGKLIRHSGECAEGFIVRSCVFNGTHENSPEEINFIKNPALADDILLEGEDGRLCGCLVTQNIGIKISGRNNYVSVGAYKDNCGLDRDYQRAVIVTGNYNMAVRLSPYIAVTDSGYCNVIR